MQPLNYLHHSVESVENEGKLYFGGVMVGNPEDGDVINKVEVYYPVSDIVSEVAPMKVKRNQFALVSAYGMVFAFGGYNDDNGVLSSAEMYDPLSDEWTELPSMHQKRFGCAAVELHGTIFVLGGYYNHEEFSSVESICVIPFCLDKNPKIAKDFDMNDSVMPCFFEFVGKYCKLLTLFHVIKDKQELLNAEVVNARPQKRAKIDS